MAVSSGGVFAHCQVLTGNFSQFEIHVISEREVLSVNCLTLIVSVSGRCQTTKFITGWYWLPVCNR